MPTDPPSESLWGSFWDLLRQKGTMGHETNAVEPDQIVCICILFIPVGAFVDILMFEGKNSQISFVSVIWIHINMSPMCR